MTTTAEAPIADAPSGGKVPLIELRSVGKSYGNIIAPKDINLSVCAGPVPGVLSSTGSGTAPVCK